MPQCVSLQLFLGTLPCDFLSRLSAGLAGFFPLHPMTITEAERRKALAQATETVTSTEEGVEEEEKQPEV